MSGGRPLPPLLQEGIPRTEEPPPAAGSLLRLLLQRLNVPTNFRGKILIDVKPGKRPRVAIRWNLGEVDVDES